MTSLKSTISKKDEEIERLKLLNATVGGISKQIQKQSSGSYKHLVEGDIQPRMFDHIQQNEFLRPSENARRKTQGFSDMGFNERSSDISDNNSLALGNETDGSSDNSSSIISHESRKSSDTMKK